MANRPMLQILGASELELFELEEMLGESELTRQEIDAGTSADHGDLGLTAAVVIVSTAVIHAVAVWLAKRRTEEEEREGLTMETRPDGTVILDLRRMSRGKLTESPDPRVVQGLQTRLTNIFQAAPSLLGFSNDKPTEARP